MRHTGTATVVRATESSLAQFDPANERAMDLDPGGWCPAYTIQLRCMPHTSDTRTQSQTPMPVAGCRGQSRARHARKAVPRHRHARPSPSRSYAKRNENQGPDSSLFHTSLQAILPHFTIPPMHHDGGGCARWASGSWAKPAADLRETASHVLPDGTRAGWRLRVCPLELYGAAWCTPHIR